MAIEMHNNNRRIHMVHTPMLHVLVDDELEANAAKNLPILVLAISDAILILLTRINKKVGLPVRSHGSRNT
jgi:antitoxin component of RelBE/YafQ-DinJ toxin-antitoxin module